MPFRASPARTPGDGPGGGGVTATAVVGLGIMGSAMAGHLLASGHAVFGYDVDAARVR